MIETNRNGVSDRRGSSKRRNSDVSTGKFPVVPKDFYQGALTTKQLADDKVNLRTRQLCLARIKLMSAMLSIDVAIKQWKPEEGESSEVHNALRSIRDNQLEKAVLAFPLEIK